MRKLFLLSAFLVGFVAAPTFAQMPFTLGVKGGLNLANVTGDDVSDDAEMLIGFHAGAYAQFDLAVLTIQPELLYTMKGSQEEGTMMGVDYSGTSTLNYLEIPVLVKYNVLPTPMMKASVYAGPSLAFLLSANHEQEVNGETTDTDIADDLTSTDFGLNVGASVELSKLMIDVRYNMGLASVDDSGADADYKNSVIMLSVGYALM
jgi:hypothetical protein